MKVKYVEAMVQRAEPPLVELSTITPLWRQLDLNFLAGDEVAIVKLSDLKEMQNRLAFVCRVALSALDKGGDANPAVANFLHEIRGAADVETNVA